MSAAPAKYGRVFDGSSFQDVVPPPRADGMVPSTTTAGPNKATIFVSLPQFRDGKRCAQTLQRLFRSASRPDRIAVGLIEQTDAEHPKEDPTCLEEYCKLEGHAMKEHEAGIAHKGERQADWDRVMAGCPRAKDQIRSVRFHHLAAKGPVYARSFARKVLGNEEFCLQIDAHMDFAKGWDSLAVKEWMKTGNEYAILSNVPSKEKDKQGEVPRQCDIKIGSEGVPLYENKADGKAIGLAKPLLSTAHSTSFAFGKCHYETNVPHDPFAQQLLETEKFPRYARAWTRGYDFYSPSQNIVFKNPAILHPLHHAEGHGEQGERKWPKNDNERRDAHIRMKVLLDVHHGITSAEAASLGSGSGVGGHIATARANLGGYGLGKRRTLEQLQEFTGITLPSRASPTGHGNEGKGCANPTWVPYDTSISPRANLFDGSGKADGLDLEPEFPLRTLPDATGGQYDHPFAMGNAAWNEMSNSEQKAPIDRTEASSDVPYSMVFLLWILGLAVWGGSFVRTDQKAARGMHRSAHASRSSGRKPRRKILQCSLVRTMKLSLALLAAALAPSADAFSATAPGATLSRSSTALHASRNRDKIASRSKWAEGRGYGALGAAVADADVAAGLMTNDEGLEYVRLANANGDTSDIYLFGGVVTSYVAGGQEYIAVRPDAKMDGSKPISGGLSHCWPQFGPGEIQQHGFARNVNWTVKSMTDTTVELEMAPSDYTKEMWDKEFLCTFSVSLEDDKLATKMFVENKGEEAFAFQAALHSYFTVSALDNLAIAGSFKGKEFLNKMVGEGEMQTEEREEITISEEYDRVYMGVNDPVLKDSGTGKALTVANTAGYEDTVLWNPYGDEGMGYNNFVCVESVKFDPVTLEGGSSWTGDMALQAGDL